MADYSNAIFQADKIYNLSTDLETKISSLEALRIKIKGEWFGPASEEYQNQLSRLIADMRITKQNLIEASSKIKETANAQSK